MQKIQNIKIFKTKKLTSLKGIALILDWKPTNLLISNPQIGPIKLRTI